MGVSQEYVFLWGTRATGSEEEWQRSIDVTTTMAKHLLSYAWIIESTHECMPDAGRRIGFKEIYVPLFYPAVVSIVKTDVEIVFYNIWSSVLHKSLNWSWQLVNLPHSLRNAAIVPIVQKLNSDKVPQKVPFEALYACLTSIPQCVTSSVGPLLDQLIVCGAQYIYAVSKKTSAPGILQMQHSNCFIWNGIHYSGFALFWKLKKKKKSKWHSCGADENSCPSRRACERRRLLARALSPRDWSFSLQLARMACAAYWSQHVVSIRSFISFFISSSILGPALAHTLLVSVRVIFIFLKSLNADAPRIWNQLKRTLRKNVRRIQWFSQNG